MRFNEGERRCEMVKNIQGYSLLTVVIVAVVVSLIVSVATTSLTGKVITGNAIGNYANELWGKVLRISGDGKGQFAAGSTSTYSTITSISDKSNTNSARTPLNIDASEVNVKGDLNLSGGIIQDGIRKESYLLRAKVYYDSSDNRNETTIEKFTSSGWTGVCQDRKIGDRCSIGDVEFYIREIKYVPGGDEYVVLRSSGRSILQESPRDFQFFEKRLGNDGDGQFVAGSFDW